MIGAVNTARNKVHVFIKMCLQGDPSFLRVVRAALELEAENSFEQRKV